MIYCYSIDKICAITASGKIFFISTRVFPLVNQSILDEMSGTINFNELSLTKKLLVDAPLDSNVCTFKFIFFIIESLMQLFKNIILFY